MADLSLSRKLYAASVALQHDDPKTHREMLIGLCAEVQAELMPPFKDLLWRDNTGRSWKVEDMNDGHIVNALHVLARRPDEPLSPMFKALYYECRERYHQKKFHRWMWRKFLDARKLARELGWLDDSD